MRLILVLLLLLGPGSVRAQEPGGQASSRASGSSLLFPVPADVALKCSEYQPQEAEARASGKVRLEYVIGEEPLPRREIHVEVDSARRLSAIADMVYEGSVSAGGAMVTAGAVFEARGDHGVLVRASRGAPPAPGSPAASPSRTVRALTNEELSAARALGTWLLERRCGGPRA